MGKQIYKLIYTSSATSSMSSSELFEILKVAKENNAIKNITGILIYGQNKFFQLLEGGKREVLELYQIIEKDPRHHNVQQVLHETSGSRDFPDWSMSLHSIDHLDSSEITKEFHQLVNKIPNNQKARILLNRFKADKGVS